MYKTYDFTLSGHEADENEALTVARQDVLNGAEYQEVETLPTHRRHIDTIRGVGVWYDYGADYYFFTDETQE